MIPRRFFTVFGMTPDFGGKPFAFGHYLSVLSCRRMHPDADICVYFEWEPSGFWWTEAMRHARADQTQAPREIHGRPLVHYAHRADVFRLQELQVRGGVYFDLDNIFARPYDELLSCDTLVMGEERMPDGTVGLCNAVMLAPAHSSFIDRWLDEYRSFRSTGRDKYWHEHSVLLPQQLALQHPDEIRRLDHTAFFAENWGREGIRRLFRWGAPPRSAYSFHLWESFTYRKLTRANPLAVLIGQGIFHRVGRRSLGLGDALRLTVRRGRSLIAPRAR